MRLARVGIEAERGYLQGGIAGWKQAGFSLAELPQTTVQNLHERLAADGVRVLDVRREQEWLAGHIASAAWWALDNFKVATPEVDRSLPLAVHCKSGYRSMIACSLLQRAGFQNIINVIGGFDAWRQAQLPFVSEMSVSV
jgi:hydroxyacylglutathione hydrolase